jgi:hypothetical protein
MNTLIVTANGCPNSFARRVQVDPTIAVDLLRECRVLTAVYRANEHVSYESLLAAVGNLSRYVGVLEKLHRLDAAE